MTHFSLPRKKRLKCAVIHSMYVFLEQNSTSRIFFKMQSSRNVYFGENEALQLDGSGLHTKNLRKKTTTIKLCKIAVKIRLDA